MENANAMKIADLQADHQIAIGNLKQETSEQLKKAEEDLWKVREVVGLTQITLEKAEEENRDLQAKLEEAATNAESGSESEQKLKEASRRISELQEELEDTKTVSLGVSIESV
jgi:DNA repair ATPase RecN